MKFLEWDRAYKLHAYGETQAQVARYELARELIFEYATTEKLQDILRIASESHIKYGGYPDAGSYNSSVHEGGLDFIYNMICDRCEGDDENEDEDDVESFERFARKPHQSMRTCIIDFDSKWIIASAGGKLVLHLTRTFFKEAGLKSDDPRVLVGHVGGGRNKFKEINVFARLRDHRTGAKGGVDHYDGTDAPWETWCSGSAEDYMNMWIGWNDGGYDNSGEGTYSTWYMQYPSAGILYLLMNIFLFPLTQDHLRFLFLIIVLPVLIRRPQSISLPISRLLILRFVLLLLRVTPLLLSLLALLLLLLLIGKALLKRKLMLFKNVVNTIIVTPSTSNDVWYDAE